MSDLIAFDQKLFTDFGTLAGLDEAGRGALAGPVFVGCSSIDLTRVDLDENLDRINDSKQLTERSRESLFGYLAKNSEIRIGIGQASNGEIDQWGINKAVSLAADRAIGSLRADVDLFLVDRGIKLSAVSSCREIKKGDEKSVHIAAASVLAKVARDRYMKLQSRKYPQYGWERNVGYGTGEHRESIKKFGPCPLHRKSYKLT